VSQGKSLGQSTQPTIQKRAFVNLVDRSESMPTVLQSTIFTRPRITFLENKPLTHQAASPQKSGTVVPLLQVSHRSSVSEQPEESSLLSIVRSLLKRENESERTSNSSVTRHREEDGNSSYSLLSSSPSPSLLSSVIRVSEQSEQNGLSSVSSVTPERRQESPLLSEISSRVQREEEREDVSTNPVSSQSEEVVDRSQSLLSSSPSLLSSVIRVSEQPERNGLSSVSSVMPERRQENPLLSELSSSLQREEERERGSHNPVSSQSEEVVDRNHSLLSSPLSLLPSVVNLLQQSEQSDLSLVSPVRREENSPLLMVSSSLQREQELERGLSTDEEEQQNQVVLNSVEIIEDSSLKAARLREETLKRAEASMDGLTSDFTEISEALWGNPGVEDLIHQQEKLEILKRKSAEFKQYLYPLDPVINDEFRSEEARRRVNRLLSRLSDHLGWVEGLELRLQSFLNPRRESFSQVLARRTPGHPSLKLRISPSSLKTVILPQEQEESVEDSTEIATPEKSLHLVLRLRASSSESRPTIPLEGSLETGDDLIDNSTEAMTESNPLHLVLRLRASSPESRPTTPPEGSLETGDDLTDNSTEAMTTPNSLHLVLRLKASSEGSSAPILLEEKLESAKKFIQDSKIMFSSIWEGLFGNHTEENLRLQQNRITDWQEEADRFESGLNRFKSSLMQMDEQQQVQTVLSLFDEIDCKWAQVVQRLSFLQSKAVDEKLKGLAVQIEGLRNEGSSIDRDLYEDQREDPNPLKGHGEVSLNFQEKRLSELQKRAREVGENLLLLSSQVTGEHHSSKRLHVSQLIGQFNDGISSFRQVQSRLNIIRSGTSFLSLETEDPFFSFIPSEGATSSQKILPSEFSTDFTPEEEFKGLEESTKALKRDLLEFVETLFGEHAVESLKLHETNFVKLQETANELEARLMFVDSQISKDWRSSQRKQINELMYSFGNTLCEVRKIQERLNFLKYPSSSPSLVSPPVNSPVEDENDGAPNKQLKSLKESLSKVESGLWHIDSDLYIDHGETNLNIQEERLAQLKKTLKELEESLSTLDSQTSKDLQSKERGFVNTLLESLSKSQCFMREMEKRLNYLKSPLPHLQTPVIPLTSVGIVSASKDTLTLETEEISSSLATDELVAQDLQNAEEDSSRLGRGLFEIDEDLYIDHTEKNLSFQEEKLSQLKNLLQKVEESLSSLDSKIPRKLKHPQRKQVNSLLGEFSRKQCFVRELEKRLNHLKSPPLSRLHMPVTSLSSVDAVSVIERSPLSLETEEIEGLPSSFPTEPSLEERLQSARNFIQDLGERITNISYTLFGTHHSEETLNLQQQAVEKLMRETDEVESGLNRLRSSLAIQNDQQEKVTQVLVLFDEIDSDFSRALTKIDMLRKQALSK